MPKAIAGWGLGRRAPWALLLVALALYFHLASPPESANASRVYLDRAAVALNALPAGVRTPVFPAWSAAAIPLLAPVEWVSALSARGTHATLADHLRVTHDRWRALLRFEWSLLVAISIALALRLLSDAPHARACQGLFVLWSLLLPGWKGVVAGLAPVALATPLLLLLFTWRDGAALRGARALFLGAVVGLVLAWTPFVWPAALACAAWVVSRRRANAQWVVSLGFALLIAIALEPVRVTHPHLALERFVQDWAREGGWPIGIKSGGRSASLLSSNGFFGAWSGLPLLALALIPLLRPRLESSSRGTQSRAWLAVVSFCLQMLLPFLFGAERGGAAQASVAPLLMLSAIDALADIAVRVARPFVVIAAAGALVLLPLIAAPRPTSRVPEEEMRAAIAQLVGSDVLWLSERPLPGAADAPGRAWILPRDSRDAARYDFAYWHRWYADFRYVLLSGAQVKANLERDDARFPRAFYRRIEADGRLIGQWGDGVAGFRLYRMEEGSAWSRPLGASELDSLRLGPDLVPFLSSLASVELEAKQSGTATTLLRAGLRLAPGAPGLWNNLGLVFLTQGDPKEAASAFDEGLRRDPNSVELLYNSARAYTTIDVPSRAERNLRIALTLRPDFAPTHYELARAFLAQGKLMPARQALRRFLSMESRAAERAPAEAALLRVEALLDSTGADTSGTR